MHRRFLTFLACVLSMPLCARMMDGIRADGIAEAITAGCVLGVAYLLLRPILRILTFPIGCIMLGLSGFVLDAVLVYLLGVYVPGFHVDGVIWACLAAALVDGVCLIAGGVRA